jgi:hypothetical protein
MNHQGIIRDEGQVYICPFFLLFNIAVLSKSLILIRRWCGKNLIKSYMYDLIQ